MLSQRMEPFTCKRSHRSAITWSWSLVVSSMATVGAVEQELRRLHGSGFRNIVLDLGGLTFMDSSGLHFVTRWAQEASRDGFVFSSSPDRRFSACSSSPR